MHLREIGRLGGKNVDAFSDDAYVQPCVLTQSDTKTARGASRLA